MTLIPLSILHRTFDRSPPVGRCRDCSHFYRTFPDRPDWGTCNEFKLYATASDRACERFTPYFKSGATTMPECPECYGDKFIDVDGRYVECPTCEGTGEVCDRTEFPNNCPACGEPIREDEKWCEHHKAAEELEQ